jgi:hypothetical protein
MVLLIFFLNMMLLDGLLGWEENKVGIIVHFIRVSNTTRLSETLHRIYFPLSFPSDLGGKQFVSPCGKS